MTTRGTGPAIPLPPPSNTPQTVLAVDAKSPDAAISRDPRLIRLTGAHPFNCEPPLAQLFDSGFLTPPELHYVRNHGAVPLSSEPDDPAMLEWPVHVDGLVDRPTTFTLRQLLTEFQQYTIPVTMACCGNRRKEQNMVRKGNGFNWGAGGVSTSLYTGVLLSDVLARVSPDHSRARYVVMRGADHLPNGNYETNIQMFRARNPECAIMLVYKQNGEWLYPDHGRPLRVILPGIIGGRAVKWLRNLIVTDKPSENYYHIYDNRVLPTLVSPDMAKQNPSWWKDERYALYEMNIQTITAYPEHGKIIPIPSDKSEQNALSYKIQGFGYNGGGRRIGRIEVTLDGGKTWKLANIDYPEDLYRKSGIKELYGGKLGISETNMACWCWCFWDITVTLDELAEAADIVVRGMDDAMAVQPRDMYWNVLSMLNNCWFRVAIRKETDQDGHPILRFEHPTQPAMTSGGWMERVKNSGGNLLAYNWGEVTDVSGDEASLRPEYPNPPLTPPQSVSMTNPKVSRVITWSELKMHNKDNDAWFVVNDEVYDGTGFLKEHPGGPESIVMVAGEDATEDFMSIHSETAKQMLIDFHIGHLDRSGKEDTTEEPGESDGVLRETFLQAKRWNEAKVVSRKDLSHDVRLFRLELQHSAQTLGLPCGQHLLLRASDPVTKEAVIRAYTPISETDEPGHVDLLIKIYHPNPQLLQQGGKMTRLLEAIQPGASLSLKGPLGSFTYHGNGRYTHHGHERSVKQFHMVAAGSGITPIYQVLRAICQKNDDNTRTTLIYGNREQRDIMCREMLEEWSQEHMHKVQIIHTLSRVATNVSELADGNIMADPRFLTGRISRKILDERFSSPAPEDSCVLACGPPGLMDLISNWAKDNNRELVIF